MSVLLAIETATSSCSAALKRGDQIYQRSQEGSNIHSQVLLSMIESLLSEADILISQLDAIAVSQGPGSFTGLRIGIGVAQGLAFGTNCPMIGVSSLDVLASQTENNGTIISTIDARMSEVYWRAYNKVSGTITGLGGPRVTRPQEIRAPEVNDELILVGNAWSEYQGKFDQEIEAAGVRDNEIVFPTATALLLLAEKKWEESDFVLASDFAPVYVRDDVAKKSQKSRKKVV